jgi:hypothetical protein
MPKRLVKHTFNCVWEDVSIDYLDNMGSDLINGWSIQRYKIWIDYWKIVDLWKVGASWRKQLAKGIPLNGMSDPRSLPLTLCFHPTVICAASATWSCVMILCLSQAQSNGSSWPCTETYKTMKQNKSFLFETVSLRYLSH